MTSPSDVLVVGGGFAGLYAAKTAARHGLRVVLMDARGQQTFQPLLYQVATGLLPVDVVDYPLHEMAGVEVVTADAIAVDLPTRSVTAADGQVLSADRLVLATGASVDFFGVPGAADHARPLYTSANALSIKAQIGRLAEAGGEFDVVVVGAGATGVELAGVLGEVIRDILPRTYPRFAGESVRVHVVDRASAPLAHMSERSQAYAREVLVGERVILHLGASVTEVTASGVRLDDGSALSAGLVVWAGGLSVRTPSLTPEAAADSDGRIVIDATLRIPGHPDVYCIGDCSADSRSALPQLGSVAKQQGIHVGHSLRRQAQGREPRPFHYRDLGTMAMLGHDRAVVEAGPHHVQIDGRAAAAMWLGLHASLLPDGEARSEAVHDWLHEWVTGTSTFLEG